MVIPLKARSIAMPIEASTRSSATRLSRVSAVVGISVAAIAAEMGAGPANPVPRYSATASMPIAEGGMFNFAPLWGVTVVWMLAGFALTTRSGWIGAAGTLGLEGEARRRAAAGVVTAASGVSVLLSTLLRMLV